MKRIIYIIAVIFTLIVGAVFSARNASEVTLDFIFTVVETNLALAIVLALILGAGLGVLVSLTWMISARREIQRLKKQVAVSKKELTNLRAIPIKDEH